MTGLPLRRVVQLVLPVLALTACGDSSGPGATADTTPAASTAGPPTSSSPAATASGPVVSFSSQGYNYTIQAVSAVGSAVQIDSPYRTSPAIAPAGQRYATVTMALTNAMSDRAVPLNIATVGDIDFSFAVAFRDSAGLPSIWQGNCKEGLGSVRPGLCVDLATRVQSTSPSHVHDVTSQIPAGGTVTMKLYSSEIPTSLSLDKLQFEYMDSITGDETKIPLTS